MSKLANAAAAICLIFKTDSNININVNNNARQSYEEMKDINGGAVLTCAIVDSDT